MKTKNFLLALMGALLVQSLLGCAAFLVPESPDPAKKLAIALDLIDSDSRPIPAERLIREAMYAYQKTNDKSGLSEAHRIYGIFYKSDAVRKWQQHYEKHGFPDPSARFDARYEKALEHFGLAHALSEARQDFGSLSNIELQRALSYRLMGNKRAACASFDGSIRWHKRLLSEDPSAKVVLSKEYSSFEQGILDMKRRAGCDA